MSRSSLWIVAAAVAVIAAIALSLEVMKDFPYAGSQSSGTPNSSGGLGNQQSGNSGSLPPMQVNNSSSSPQTGGPSQSLDGIEVPDGFVIHSFAELSTGLSKSAPRFMMIKDDVLFVSLMSEGKVVALRDMNGDYKAEAPVTFIDGLNRPHGLEYSDGWYYIAEENRVIRVKDANSDMKADSGSMEAIITGMPSGDGHFTRTIKIKDGSLYVSVGSSCNTCAEASSWRAAIAKCDLDGKNCAPFATGLRNAVGIVFHPQTGKLYATENGRDHLGNDLPPDEINLVEGGRSYGWPICYGKNVHDTDYDKNVYVQNPCAEPSHYPSLVDLQAHSAPLGLAFYNGNNFPQEYSGDLFVAYHGSWNRDDPTGYKIVSIDASTLSVKDFATGWLEGTTVNGRPVDIIVASDGSMFVSDDFSGSIYRIYYKG